MRAKAVTIVRGDADIYLHAGGRYEWGSCAPVTLASPAGFHCSRTDGSPLCYNRENTFLPDLLICHEQHTQNILREISELDG